MPRYWSHHCLVWSVGEISTPHIVPWRLHLWIPGDDVQVFGFVDRVLALPLARWAASHAIGVSLSSTVERMHHIVHGRYALLVAELTHGLIALQNGSECFFVRGEPVPSSGIGRVWPEWFAAHWSSRLVARGRFST